MQLNPEYKKQLLKKLKNKTFNAEREIEYLTQQGFSEQEAQILIKNEVVSFAGNVISNYQRRNDEFEERKAAIIIVLIIGIIGPIFGITSIIYYLVVTIVSGAIGYWGYKRTPIAGVVGCIVGMILMPITYFWYVSGRASIIKIELIIPILMAAVPAFLVGVGIIKLLYPEENQ